jgi:hypothetical protein
VSLAERRLAEETRERFLREIVARVPLDRLETVHLFPPIRQGGQESGVAVVTAGLPPAPAPEAVAGAPVGEVIPDETVDGAPDAPAPALADATSADPIGEPACDPTEGAAGPSLPPENAVDGADAGGAGASADGGAVESGGSATRPRRHTVFMARYRLTLKGPERGRWEADVVEEADAPLVTVDAVVRGVQRRAGDEADPERLDAAAVARLVSVAEGAAARTPP